MPIVGAAGVSGAAPVTIGWNFNDDDATVDTAVPQNVTVSPFSIGNTNGTVADPVNATSPSSGYVGASGEENIGNAARTGGLNTSENGSAFYEVTFTPAAGYTVQVSDYDFGTRSTGTGPRAYTLRQVNGPGTDVMTGTIASDSAWTFKNNTPFAVRGSTALGLRLYVHGGVGSPTSGTINSRLDDIAIAVEALPNTHFDVNGTSTGSGTANTGYSFSGARWNAFADGTGPTGVFANGQTPRFSAGTDSAGMTYSVSVDTTVNANGLGFEEGNVTLSSGGGTLTLTGPAVTVNSGAAANIFQPVSGSVGLAKAGTGSLSLAGNNTYTGTTAVNAGTLAVSGGTAIPNTSPVVLSNASGAVLQLDSSETIASLSGGGAAGGNVSLVGSSALTVEGTASTTYSGNISGSSGTLVKQGSGALELTGANTYGGGTTIAAGTLRASNSTGSASGSGAVAINGGRLEGEGAIVNSGGSVAVNSGGIIAPGNGASDVGTLTTNDQVWAGGGIYEFDANASGTDLLNLASLAGDASGSAGDLAIGASDVEGDQFVIRVVRSGGALEQGQWVTIAAGTGGVTGFDATKFVFQDVNNPAQTYDIRASGDGASGSGGGFTIDIVATPEPTTSLLFGSGASALLLSRFRWRRLRDSALSGILSRRAPKLARSQS